MPSPWQTHFLSSEHWFHPYLKVLLSSALQVAIHISAFSCLLPETCIVHWFCCPPVTQTWCGSQVWLWKVALEAYKTSLNLFLCQVRQTVPALCHFKNAARERIWAIMPCRHVCVAAAACQVLCCPPPGNKHKWVMIPPLENLIA